MKMNRWLMKPIVLTLSAVLALVGCGAVQPVSEPQYFRLTLRTVEIPKSAPLSDMALWMDSWTASGLYLERPMVYALKPDSTRLRQYHYQYWTDPVPAQLRRRLADRVREARLSDTVSERPPEVDRRVRISGVVNRFERVRQPEGTWSAVVEFELKAENTSTGALLVRRSVTETEPANGDKMEASVAAFATASDRALAAFVEELRVALSKAEPG